MQSPKNLEIVGKGAKLFGVFILAYHKRKFIALFRAEFQNFQNLGGQYLFHKEQQAGVCFTGL
jgi:hypothetical protein